MKCPYCGYEDCKVIDSRDVDDGVRRRRQCLSCDARFTTYERLQPASLFVIKKDERREEFDREKLLSGIRKACEKRPLPTGAIEKLVDDIEAELYRLVIEQLKKLDHIAYIRFASVYHEFTDISALKEEVDTLLSGSEAPPGQLPLLPEVELAIKGRRGSRRQGKLRSQS
jgi:transcriptional repressor NrdR